LSDGELLISLWHDRSLATDQHFAGVSQVSIYGVKGAIRIKVDPGALASAT
jgi:hypothetical protein